MKRKAEESMDESFLASSQLSSMRVEVRRLKRELAASETDLQRHRVAMAEMEAYVSVVQRCWSQFDLDAQTLLESITDREQPTSSQLHILHQLLDVSNDALIRNPVEGGAAASLRMDIDRWSTADDIATERDRILSSLDSRSHQFPALQETLASHAAKSLRLLETVAASFHGNNSPLRALADHRTLQTGRLNLQDAVTKLRSDLVRLQADYKTKCHELERLERFLDKNAMNLTASDEKTPVTTPVAEEGDLGVSSGPSSDELRLLQRQLQVSEAARDKAESLLTEALAQSSSGGVAGDEAKQLQAVIDELRVQYKQKLTSVLEETSAAQEKALELEYALARVEAEAKQRMAEVAGAAEAELRLMREDKAQAMASLATAQSELSQLEELRAQHSSLQALEEAARRSAEKYHSQLREARETRALVESNLVASRQREVQLEAAMQGVEGAELVRLAQERAQQCEAELAAAKASTNDLIMEIESVAVEEERTRAQAAGLLRRMEQLQTTQRSTVEENLRLLEQMSALQQKHTALQLRAESSEAQARKQDSLIATNQVADGKLRAALLIEKKIAGDHKAKWMQAEELVATQQTLIKRLETDLEAAKNAQSRLKARCGELNKELELERKLRVGKEMEADGAGKGRSLSKEDSAMLDMTLSMLRCSICKDRFKNVALTRCYHLFCNECIDDSIRNRNRKCPACGEKFGQDDVKSIFFTH